MQDRFISILYILKLPFIQIAIYTGNLFSSINDFFSFHIIHVLIIIKKSEQKNIVMNVPKRSFRKTENLVQAISFDMHRDSQITLSRIQITLSRITELVEYDYMHKLATKSHFVFSFNFYRSWLHKLDMRADI
ncbi:hypothetical protein ACJX0J_028373 [Zea mays]